MAKYTGHTITSDSALGAADIQRSLRFNRADNAVLTRSPSSSTDSTKQTLSFWFKVSSLVDATNQGVLFAGGSDGSWSYVQLWSNTFYFGNSAGPYWNGNLRIRDFTSWYHATIVIDTTQGTANDRQKLYINGVQQERGGGNNPSQDSNYEFLTNSSWTYYIGKRAANDMNFEGYMAEINFVQGQALEPTQFGFTDPVTNIWMPKRYEGTYGTNGFYLDFSDNSSTAALGIDKSPNGNDWTTNNFSVASGKDGDSFIDTPSNNFTTLNPLVGSTNAQSLSDGNLTRSGGARQCMATFELLNGKYYFEYKAEDSNGNHSIGVCQIDTDQRDRINTECAHYFGNGEYKIENNNQTSGFSSYASGDIIGVAVDTTLSPPKIWFAKNNTWQGTGNPTTTGYSLTSGKKYAFSTAHGSNSGSTTGTAFFGAHQGGFNYDPPSGFKALSTKNLPPNVPSTIRPQKHFETILWAGNGSSQTISGLEFAPDLVWLKCRNSSSGRSHIFTDTVRGATKSLLSPESDAEDTFVQDLTAFTPDGFSVGSNGRVNENSTNLVGWCWKAGGAAVANSDGNTASQVSVNTEAGFSIVTYTGTGSSTTIGHGLGKKPEMIFMKSRSASGDWAVLESNNTTAEYTFYLNDNNAYGSSSGYTFYADTPPTSSVWTVNSASATNASGVTYVAYCWTSIPGYSKIGKYTGNGSANGAYVHVGFRPAWVLFKRIDYGGNWFIVDNKRDTFNECTRDLYPNSFGAETNNPNFVDFLSNGFKLRTTGTAVNASGGTYIYMAFAEQPGTTPFETFSNSR